MSPKLTAKFGGAVSWLHTFQLVPSAIQALTDAGPDAVYAEMTRRGYVWSTDLGIWRKSRKPRKMHTVVAKSGFLDRAAIRVIVHADEVDGAIEELRALADLAGYELIRVNVHAGRTVHECLIYATLRQLGAHNG